jgi:transaldolase
VAGRTGETQLVQFPSGWIIELMKAVNIDIDSMDPTFIKSLPRKPHDKTSNQLRMGIQLAHTSNTKLLKSTAKEFKATRGLALYSKMVESTILLL